MTTLNFDEARLVPLQTDDDIERRVAGLIGRANVRQLWLLFLDDEAIQLPLLIPIDGLPSQPTNEEAARVVENIADLMIDIQAASIITVWERYGAPRLTPQDAAWARSLHSACLERHVTLRAMLLSHRTGVSWIAPADYAAPDYAAPGFAAHGLVTDPEPALPVGVLAGEPREQRMVRQ